MEKFTEILSDMIARGDLEAALVGGVAAVVVMLMSKLPSWLKSFITKVIDKTDEKLDKNP